MNDMKRRILFLLLIFCSIEAFCQLPPSNVIDLGKHGLEEEFTLTNTVDTKYLPNTIFGEAADVWYKLEVLWPMNLHIRTHGSRFQTFAVYILDRNLEKVADNRGADHSVDYDYPYISLDWYVDPGTYYIVNEGYIDRNYSYWEYPLTMTLQGSPDVNTFEDLGTWSIPFQKSFTQDTSFGFDSFYRGSGEPVKDMTYQISFEYPMSMIVSHCDTQYPSFIAILDESGKILYRSDQSDQHCDCELNYGEYHAYIKTDILLPGTYRIVSEGIGWEGTIVTSIQVIETPAGDMKDNAFRIGWHSTDFEYSDVRDTREFTDHYQGVAGNDVFYQFGLEVPMDIFLSHCGSEVDETFIYLLDGEGNCIASSEDYSGDEDCSNPQAAFICKKELPEGTYYVVSEGYSEDGKITTHIRGVCSQPNTAGYSGNFIFSRSFTNEIGSKYLDKIDYFDGFGRLEESVQKQYSPSGSDLITLQEYDGFNRPSNLWLPAVFTGNNGQPVSSVSLKNAAITQYGDSKPFSMTVYESSSLNRELERYAPGEDWHTGSHGVKTSYLTNIWGNDTLNCINFELKVSNDTLPYIVNKPNYPSSELYVTRIQDEDGNTSFEFKDKLGQVLLNRRVEYQAGGKNLFDTYYLYDDYGNCVIVLPPEASAAIAASGSLSFTGPDSPVLRDYAYMYQYDSRNRCIGKKLPGCDWCLYIYDKANRLIFLQDGNQRQKNEWLFNIPDALGRVVLTGICSNDFAYSSSPLAKSVVKGEWNDRTSATKGYQVSGVTLDNPVVLSASYYDDYSFTGYNGIPTLTNSSVGYEPDYEMEGFGKRYMTSSKGLLTGTLARLDDLSTSSEYLYSVMYYDHHGRIVQAKSGSHLRDGEEKEYLRYNFTGQLLKRKHIHSAKDKPTQSEVYDYAYDHAGRLLKTVHQLNDGSSVTLVDNEYDECGRLKRNRRNGNSNLKTEYAYNVRSWTKEISGLLFNQRMYYTDGVGVPCYNGNISSMTWKTGDSLADKGYKYSYDGLSRLTDAVYGEGRLLSANADRFNEQVTGYDKNGNITGLLRYGKTGASTYGLIDNLNLTYEGNQLKSVYDNVTNSVYGNGMEFKDGVDATIEYKYDGNGNLTKDLNKKITDIQYNCLNLPSRIEFENGNSISFSYAADGTKLRTMHVIGKDTTVTDYCGNVVYENGVPKLLLTGTGYVSLNDNKYHYFIQDYQGNNRVVADEDGTLEEVNDYYPFGGLMASSVGSVQPYKYNGKELDRKGGRDWYDYGARQYDAVLGRWHAMDPMAEKYYDWSPYVYCANNPINIIDPNGCDWYQSTNNEDEYIWREGHKDIDGYTRLGSSMSFQIGEDSYLNFYQNAGIKANKATNAFELIASSGKLQNQLLGKNSPLSEESKSELFNGLNSRAVDDIARPIGETMVEYGAGALIGGILGKTVGYIGKKMLAKAAVESGMRVGQNFGKLGTIVENPGIGLTSFSKHGLNQAITRGVNPSTISNTVKNPVVVLQQSRGNFLFLTREAVVVMNNAGRIVSTYPASMFDNSILNVLK